MLQLGIIVQSFCRHCMDRLIYFYKETRQKHKNESYCIIILFGSLWWDNVWNTPEAAFVKLMVMSDTNSTQTKSSYTTPRLTYMYQSERNNTIAYFNAKRNYCPRYLSGRARKWKRNCKTWMVLTLKAMCRDIPSGFCTQRKTTTVIESICTTLSLKAGFATF